MVNNYIRIGDHPDTCFIFFDTKDQMGLKIVRTRVQGELGKRGPNTTIGMWRPCPGLDYPLIGHTTGKLHYA